MQIVESGDLEEVRKVGRVEVAVVLVVVASWEECPSCDGKKGVM